jgi:excisionase family DNA binding protein
MYDRLTVAEAADRLGITKETVRKRVHRGTLHADKDAVGTVRVHVTPFGTASATASPRAGMWWWLRCVPA